MNDKIEKFHFWFSADTNNKRHSLKAPDCIALIDHSGKKEIFTLASKTKEIAPSIDIAKWKAEEDYNQRLKQCLEEAT